MAIHRCATCGEFPLFSDRHTCPPIWRVHYKPLHGDDLADAEEIHARDPGLAAERWAERYDADGDYDIVSGRSEIEVDVYDASDASLPSKRYAIEAEAVPRYWATELLLDQENRGKTQGSAAKNE